MHILLTTSNASAVTAKAAKAELMATLEAQLLWCVHAERGKSDQTSLLSDLLFSALTLLPRRHIMDDVERVA